MPEAPHDKPKDPPAFGRRKEASAEAAAPTTPSKLHTSKLHTSAQDIWPLLTKRSTAVTLVLAGSAAFIAFAVSNTRATCPVPTPGSAPELMAEYERCRSRRTSSSSSSSYSGGSGGGQSSSTQHSTATRGGFGSTGAGHASGG